MFKIKLSSRVQNILSVLFLLAVIAFGWLYKPDSTIPLKSPFTEEERKKIDARLFSELVVKNTSWYAVGKTRDARYKLIKSYADQGYEIAELMLKLFDFSGANPSSMAFDEEAFQRLKDLAKQGDASAQCLYADASQKWDKLSHNNFIRRAYIERAAAQDHPLCLMYKSGHYMRVSDNTNAHSTLEKSAQLGLSASQSSLVLFYSIGSFGYPKDIGKAKCWFQIASTDDFDTGEGAASVSKVMNLYIELKIQGVKSYKTYSTKSWCEHNFAIKPLESIKKELGYE